MSDRDATVAQLRAQVSAFAEERDWAQFHSPKNLSMSIAIEAAELMEEFQWLTEEESRAALEDAAKRAQVVAELADVLIYCLDMANVLGVDVSTAVADKLAKDARKYPADEYRGRF